METSLKAGFSQIFSCCPKNLSCPKFWGAAAPSPPPARTPMPPYPTNFGLQACSTHPLLGQSLGYPAKPTKTASPLLFWTPDWPSDGLCPAPGKNLVTSHFNEIRQKYY